MVQTIKLSQLPPKVIQAATFNDISLLSNITSDDIRQILVRSVIELVKPQISKKVKNASLPIYRLHAGASCYRIQDNNPDYTTAIFPSFGRGRMNCNFDSVKILYLAQKQDTAIAEMIGRVNPNKGQGPGLGIALVSSKWGEQKRIWTVSTSRKEVSLIQVFKFIFGYHVYPG